MNLSNIKKIVGTIPDMKTAMWHGRVIELGKVYSDPAFKAFVLEAPPLNEESGSKKK
jgi:hypothetical protein